MLYIANFESVYGRELIIFESQKNISSEEWGELVKEAIRISLERLLKEKYEGEIDSLTLLLNKTFIENFSKFLEEKGFKLVYATQLEFSKYPSATIDVDILNERLAKFNKKEAERLLGKELFSQIMEHNEKIRAKKFEETFLGGKELF